MMGQVGMRCDQTNRMGSALTVPGVAPDAGPESLGLTVRNAQA